MADIALSIVPMHTSTAHEVDPEYDETVKSSQPPPGKAVVFVYQSGGSESSVVYVNDEEMGGIWAGKYLFTILDPGQVTVKSTLQLRRSGLTYSHPSSYLNSWGSFEAVAGSRYYIELQSSKKTQSLEFRGDAKGQAKLGSMQLSFQNSYDAAKRGSPVHETVDICPFGSPVPTVYSSAEIEEWGLTCTYDRNF